MENAIRKSIDLQVPVAKVWRALSEATRFGEWFRVRIEGEFAPGKPARGRILYPGFGHLSWTVTVKEMRPEELFSFTWHPYAVEADRDYSKEEPTLVEFRLEPIPQGTRLTVTESGFERVPAVRRDEAYRMNEGGWAAQMVNLSVYLSERKSAAATFLAEAASGRARAAYERFVAPGFIHHNPYFKGDRDSLLAGMEEAAKRSPTKGIQIMKVLEEGDTVVTLSHVRPQPNDLGIAVVHFFRFEGTKIAELWDLGQPIPKDPVNENGMF